MILTLFLFSFLVVIVESFTLQQTLGLSTSNPIGTNIASSYNATIVVVTGLDNTGLSTGWVYNLSAASHQYSLIQTIQPSDVIGPSSVFGFSVALSNDASVLALGACEDDSNVGAVWIYRLNDTNYQYVKETKIIATDAIGNAQQGYSVALSSNGTILVFTGIYDNYTIGATWIYYYSSFSSSWNEYTKLVATGFGTGNVRQGTSLAITPTVDRIVVGAPSNNNYVGATWIFALNDSGSWIQETGPLIESSWTGVGNKPGSGQAVALNANGDILAIGSPGPAWTTLLGYVTLWSRNGTTWTEFATLQSTVYADTMSRQGYAIVLDSIGTTCIYGGIDRNYQDGGAWVWVQNTSSSSSSWYNTAQYLPYHEWYTGSMGNAVVLSGDDSTLFIGAYTDVNNLGGGGSWGFYT